ncbi:MAG: endonuclease III [Dethiobacter sp.]|jgi:endonuclease-3|nr:MAG: endonuclease III [Dethiobacter sp.]
MSRSREILQILEQEYPLAATALHYNTPFELLLAVILSAQTTDKQVNKITTKLFQKIKGPRDILNLGLPWLEKEIKGCGLYRQKSRQILETSRLLLDKYDGEVPRTREELMELPGVGRKTANVVLSTAFGIPAFAVDTHVQRVSRRLGLSEGKNPLAVEEEICRLVPRELWRETHHRLIAHGRRVCRARKPLCNACSLNPYCPLAVEKNL